MKAKPSATTAKAAARIVVRGKRDMARKAFNQACGAISGIIPSKTAINPKARRMVFIGTDFDLFNGVRLL